MEHFNPYRKWLGIPEEEQPPSYYRLLGIADYEDDADVVSHAADRAMAHVRTFQNGRQAFASQQILSELAAARHVLLSPEKKADYDAQLRQQRSSSGRVRWSQSTSAAPVAEIPVAAPVTPEPPPAGAVSPGEAARRDQTPDIRPSRSTGSVRYRLRRRRSPIPWIVGICCCGFFIAAVYAITESGFGTRDAADLGDQSTPDQNSVSPPSGNTTGGTSLDEKLRRSWSDENRRRKSNGERLFSSSTGPVRQQITASHELGPDAGARPGRLRWEDGDDITLARVLMQRGRVDRARALLESLEQRNVSAEGRRRIDRHLTLAGYLEEFERAFVDGMQKLAAGMQLVDSRRGEVIATFERLEEALPPRLHFTVDGAEVSYDFRELPGAWRVPIARLGLGDPVTADPVIAAYQALAPGGDRQQAVALLEKLAEEKTAGEALLSELARLAASGGDEPAGGELRFVSPGEANFPRQRRAAPEEEDRPPADSDLKQRSTVLRTIGRETAG